MADVKISALPAASTPLAGTELVPIVQSGVTSRVSVDNLTAGKSVSAAALDVQANSAAAAVTITQTGAGNALVVEDSARPDASPFIVDATGRALVGVGTTSLALNGTIQSSVQGATISGVTTNSGSAAARTHWRLGVSDVEVGGIGTVGTSMTFLTANTTRMTITNTGSTSLTATGTGGVAGTAFTIVGTNLSGATTNVGISVASTFGLGATVRGIGVQTTIATEAGGAGLATASGFRVLQGALGTAVTNQYGYWADSTLIGGTNNFGFVSEIPSGANRWNFYASGTANNYFNGNVGVGNLNPLNKLDVTGSFGRGAPVTKTGNFTLADTENWIICNGAGTITVTFPAASAWTGREVMIKTIAAQTVVSASSNVVPLAGGAAGTAILAASAGAWATLVSDGTNWVIMQA